jgi:hypothetical protein
MSHLVQYPQHTLFLVVVMRVNSKHGPIVSGDSVWMRPVTAGDEVHVRLGRDPLRVITAYGPK